MLNRINLSTFSVSVLFLMLFSTGRLIAQGESCVNAAPFCGSASHTFPNSTSVTAPSGPNYGCLNSVPNPMWYYMQVDQSGTIQLSIQQRDPGGNPIDVDFAMWGPFSGLSGCTGVMSGSSAPIQSSYSSSGTETIGLGMAGGSGSNCRSGHGSEGATTPPAAVAGQYYLVLVTNFANTTGNLTFTQTAGTGSTNCNILQPCSVSGLTATATCSGGSTTISGSVTIGTGMTTGTFTVSSSCGGSQTFNPPFPSAGSPGVINFSFPGGAANGQTCTITAQFSANTGCSATTTVTKPNSPAAPTVSTTAASCSAAGSSTVTNYNASNTYTFTPAGPTVGAGGVISGATPGTSYSLTTTSGGCASSGTSFTNPSQLPAPAAPAISTTAASCSAAGSSTVTNYNASNTYTFTPAGPTVGAGGVISGATPGTSYSVTSTIGGCTSSGTSFTNPSQLPAPAAPTVSTTAASCSAAGSSTITNYNASNTYTFTPAGPTVGAGGVISGATPGTSYSVTSTSGGCISTGTSFTNPSQLPAPAAPAISTTAASCSAAGSSTITNYNASNTYTFTPAGPTVGAGGVISGATPGTSYSVTSTSGGCTSTGTSFTNPVQLVTPAAPTVSTTAASCSAAGSSTVTNYNASNTYTFTPAGPTVGAGGVISGATPGTSYSVTSTSGGCTSTGTSFTNPSQLPAPAAPTVSTTAASCSAAGSSTITNYNASNTYTFTPAGPTVGAGGVISGMTTGTSYTVTAGNGSCTSVASVAFSNDAQLITPAVPLITTTPASCSAAGSSTITNYNASNTYTFTPAGPTVGAGGVISGATPGTSYNVTSTSGGCTSTGTSFTNPSQLPAPAAPTVSTTPASCSAAGSSTITNYNASNTYTFTPAGPTVGAGGMISGATPGTSYSVTSTSGGCTSTGTSFTNPVQLVTPTISAPIVMCTDGATQTLTGNPSGGTWTSSNTSVATISSGGVVTPGSTSGTTTITYTMGGCSATQVITVTALPVINIDPVSALCTSSSAVALSATPAGGTWSGTGVSGSSFDPSTATVGSNTVTYTVAAAGGCPSVDEDITITVTQAPSATIAYSSPFCTSETAAQSVALTGSTGGTYSAAPSGLTINSSTGAITPSSSTPGTYTVTYTIAAGGGCPAFTTTASVTVTALPVINIDPVSALCTSSSAVALSATPAGGTWSGTGVSGSSFDPSTATVGSNTVTYTVAAAGGCPSVDEDITITVTQAPSATIAYSSPFCTSETAAQSVALTGSTGGTYSAAPSGLTINSSTGAITPSSSTPGTYTVTYTIAAGGGCPAFTTTASVTVTALPVINIDPVSALCTSSSAVALSATPAGGTWSGTGVSGSSFDPSTATVGSNTVTYTVAAAGGCPSVDEDITITVTQAPSATIAYSSPFCTSETAAQSVALTGSTGGTYSAAPSGLTINSSTGAITPSSSTPGTYTVTYTIAAGGGCPAFTTTASVTVTALPVINIDPVSALCTSSSAVALSATPAGGTWSGTGVSGSSFDPSTATVGSNTVTYTVAAAGGCPSVDEDITITVTQAPSATIAYSSPFCTSETAAQSVALTGSTGGTYSAAPSGLTINSSTGAITPSSSTPGTYTVTYTIAAGGGCPAFTTTASVTVTALPVINIDPVSALCTSSSAVALSATPAGGTWSGTGVSGSSFDPSTATVGSNTVTYTVAAAGGCPSVDEDITITVTQAPSATIAYSSPFCTSETAAQSVALTGSTGGTYSAAPSGLTINSSTGAITPSSSTPGTYTVTYTIAAGGGCPAFTTTASVTVTALPVINIDPVSALCTSSSAVALSATPAGGTWSGTGVSGSSFDPSTATVGSNTVTYTVAAAGGCPSVDEDITITVTQAPSATIAYSSPFCTSETAAQSVALTGSTGGTYSAAPSGLTINSSTGAITPSSSTPGTYTVTYTIAAGGGCPAFTTTASVTVTALPVINIDPVSALCTSSSAVALSATPAGGTWSGTGVSGSSFDPSTATVGSNTVTYTVAAAGGCPSVDEDITITVTQAPSATIAYSSPFCTSETAAQSVALTGSTGGTYSAAPSGLTINSSTGAITPSSSTPGTYTVTYTIAAGGGCPAFTTTASVTVTALPVINIDPVSALCTSSSAVALSATPAGGTWSGTGVSGSSFDPSTATVGSNTVTYTVAAAGGCPSVDEDITITVTQAPSATIAYSSPFCTSETAAQSVALTGSTGGTYSAAPSGLTINSSTGAITPSSSTPGTYTVTYTIAAGGGCPAFTTTASVIIGELPTASVAPTDIINNCQVGGSTGSAVITAAGGYPTYEYSLTGGAPYQPSNSFTGLTSGNYTVTVRDANGCTNTATFTITDPAGGTPLTASVAPTDIINNCQVGGSTGSAVITAAGGYPTYEYSLTGGAPYQPSNSFTGLTSGNYTVTVRDANGCTNTATFTITDPAGGTPLTASVAPTDIINNCQVGGSTGSAVITAAGGYPTYEYSLTGGAPYQPSNSFTGLISGNYTVTVRDANGCTNTATFTITDPAGGTPLTATINPTDIINNCQVGGSTGSAVITATGGYPTYEYSLTGGAPYQPSNSFTGLTSGNYTVTVRDANGCTNTATFTITDPAGGTPLTASVAPTDIIHNCQVGGSTGSAVITAAGGYPTYEYSLTGGAPYQPSNSFTGLTSGNYTVTVRDANGCTTTQTFTITDPAGGTPLTATINPTDIINNCQVGGSTGSAVITATGGYPTYEYSLTGGAPYQPSNSFTGLTSGNYTVTVRDANGCTTTQTFTITDPAGGTPLTATINPTDIINNCQVGGSTGSAVITATGGYPTYEYSLTGGAPYQPSNSFTGLTSGNYTVTVRDANGCTTTQTFTITDPAGGTPLTASVAPTDIINNCQVGGSTGSAVITATGGYPTYEYSLTGGAPYQPSNSFTGLTSGNYTVTVRDANGCTNTATFTITDPAGGTPLTASVAPTDIINNCQVGGSTGSAVITAAGGYPTYEYSLTGGAPYQPSNSFTGLISGNYTVTVRDANGCTNTATFTITDPAGGTPLTASVAPTDIINNCQVGGSTGSAVITATGGYPTYEYSLTGGAPYQPSNSFTGLISGNYTVTVRDANGCTNTATFTITDPAGGTPLTATINPTDIINNCQVGGSTGSAVITATGGYPTYEYSLTGGAPYQPSNSFTGLTSGNYTVTVRDANGCTTTQTFTITDPAGGTPLTASVAPTDIINNCQVGGSTGSAVITATGGYPTYEYSLTGGAPYQPSNSFTGLTSGNYTVTVRDANGCTTTQTFTITDPAGGTPLTATINPTDIINNCQVGGSTGSAVITATGGYPTYEYSLTGGAPYQPSNSFTGLTSGNYTVTVRDANGCTTTQTFTITDPAGGTPLTATINPTDIINNCQVGGSTGSAVITATGGYPTYEYSLTGGAPYQPSNSFTGLTSGNYTVTVRDANGCTATQTFTITDIIQTASISGSTTVCQQGTSPVVTFTGSGGTAPYTFTYTINNGAAQTVTSTGNTATVSVPTTTAGTFTYALTGVSESSVTACSNTATGSVSIVVNPKPVVALNASATTICSGSAVTITPSSTPAGATFNWTATGNNTSGANNGTGTVIAANLTATATTPGTATYTVTGTLNGCTSDPVNSVITVNPLPVASAQGQTICSGTSTNVALSSNIPGTTFSWTVASSGVSGASNGSGNSINQMLTSLTGGSVTYTVTPTAGNCAGTPPITVVVDVQAMPAIAVTPSNSSICQGDQVILTATGGVNYTWTPATGLNTTTGATVTATPSATTTYIVTGASSAGCTGTSQAVVTVNSYPNLTVSSDIPVSPNITVCLGTPVTLTAAGATAYTWSPTTGLTSGSGATVTANPSATTTYTVSATSNGCTSTESVTITVNPLPVVNAGPDQTVCQGSKVTLNATGAMSYSWSDGVTNLVPFTADTTRTYTVTGISADGCTNTDYITVFVTGAPEVAFTAGRITGCVPLHIQFENLSQGATSYLWSFGDGTTSTLEDAFHDYEQNGCFDVTLTAYNGYGCSTAVKMDSMICTLPSPTAAFVASTYEITNVINEVQFNNMSEGATSYKWYFGDETGYSTKEHPKYTYDPNIFRNYNVMLVATNQDGCTDTARVVIRMTEDVVFYVPNSFTPDGDNFNNIFKPVFVEGFDAFEYEMLIFDRWGEVIFETHDINYGWDGTYLFNGGKLCQDGTYVWKITVKKTGVDDRIEKTGHITLVR